MMSYSMRRLCVVVESQSYQYRESVILWFPHGVDRYVIAWLNCSFAKIFCASQTTVFSFADCTLRKQLSTMENCMDLGLVSASSNGIET